MPTTKTNTPPFEKFLALTENDQKFKRSWEHRRPDMQDPSASGYDQSLANIAMGAGWSDQEIANLMIAHRRKYGEALKLREDYYQRTIRTAKEPMVGAKAQRALEELLDDNPNPEDILDRLSNVFGVRIVRFIRWSSNDGEPTFDLEIEECETVHFDSVTGITNPKHFCDRVLAATGRVIESGTPKEWKARVQALFNAREERDTGDDTSRESYALKLLMAEWYGWKLGGSPRFQFQRFGGLVSFGDWIATLHGVTAEAFGYSKNKDGEDGFIQGSLVELINGVERMAAHYGIDLDAVIEAKMAYNRTRSYRHGGKL